MTRRRHHCRKCGGIVCGRCSTNKTVLKQGSLPVRVCFNCFATVNLETAISAGYSGDIAQQLDVLVINAIKCYEESDFAEAKELYERALQSFVNMYGRDHPVSIAVQNLATALQNRSDVESTKVLYDNALVSVIGRSIASADDQAELDELAQQCELGSALRMQGQLEEAKAIMERSLCGLERILGPSGVKVILTVNTLATITMELGDLPTAWLLFERSLSGKERIFGVDHPNTLSTVNNMAILLYDQGNLEGSKALYSRAYIGYQGTLGVNHATTQSVKQNLQMCLDAIGAGEIAL